MASSSISRAIHNESHCKNTSSSDFGKTFFLEDWWLTKAENEIEGKRLAVSGFTYRVTHQARRLFSSAPILKIHDVFTLETTDGICVILEGFINKTRTEENGFTSDVFNHFVFGFPPNWEEYAEKCMGEGFARNAVSRMASSPQTCEKVVSKVCHVDGDKNDMGLEGREDIVLENGQHRSACTESSVEVPKVRSSQESPVTQRGEERASIFSPESLSSKRSRSGRLLLPTLEFWRNQTVIYDADRRVTGIKQDMPTVQPSRGSKSEPKRKRKKLE